MHPVIKLTVAVLLMVIAARMWPPLLYWLIGLMLMLGLIKCVRRMFRLAKKHSGAIKSRGLISFLLFSAGWLGVALLADKIMPSKISAVSIVMCFICAFIVIALLLSAVEWLSRYLHRH